MRWNQIITEGKVYQMGQRYGVSGEEVPVYSNPTTQQVITLITRAVEGTTVSSFSPHRFYLRGLCYMDKTLLVWNGYKLTHDDALTEFFPKLESHSADYTTFEADERGIQIVRPGDYNIEGMRAYQAIVQAIAQTA